MIGAVDRVGSQGQQALSALRARLADAGKPRQALAPNAVDAGIFAEAAGNSRWTGIAALPADRGR